MPAPAAIIRLPSTVYDDSVGSLIVQLIEAEKDDAGQLVLDFQDVRFYVPAALTFLLGTVSR